MMKLSIQLVGLVAAASCLAGVRAKEEPPCRRFDEIYSDGKDLCETMWSGSFRYVAESDPDYEMAYSMWFFENENPNDLVTQKRVQANMHDANYSDVSVCHLNYNHHEVPKQENDDFTECHPWHGNACCKAETVESGKKLKEAYGREWHWDRCGPLSQECERFFVQEACFYECDVHAGLFRKYGPHDYETHDPTVRNEWQLEAMPIKAGFCDGWYRACANQLFCAADDGDFFSCSKVYEEADKNAQNTPAPAPAEDDSLSTGAIVGISISAFVALVFIACSVYLMMREKKGDPLFKPIETHDESSKAKLPVSEDLPTHTVQTA